ncbi:GroES-like protein [Lentinula edodes]|uniref:GroES-like protein n=1 Tax=Lentinula lateritia TaxID=40482 RepID=A0A9W9DSU2_9AGAR|nr:GroES-like protein [Lentinula edodes]
MSPQKALILEKAKGSLVVSAAQPILKPGPGQLSVKVIAVALNPVDWKIQAWDVLLKEYPAILGLDIAGDVEEIGEGVEGFSRGDKGFFGIEMAGFQQYTLIPADIVGKIPSNIDYAQAATIPGAFTTAAISLFKAQPEGAGLNPTFDLDIKFAGRSAVIVGGSTSVGQYVIQLFKLLGYSTIIAYASAHHTDYLKSIGATHVIERGEVPVGSLAEAAKKIANSPIEIAYNAVGDKDSRAACIDAIIEGGQVPDVNPEVDNEDSKNGKRVFTIFATPHHPPHREFCRILWKTLPNLVQKGVIVPNRVEKLPNGLAGIDQGLQKLKANEVSGVKLVAFPQETA